MSVETMLSYLKNSPPELQLIIHVGLQCAPVLKNLKVANLINTAHNAHTQIRSYLKKSRILCYVLYADNDRDVLLLFRRDRMESLLSDLQIQLFLGRFGYTAFDIPSVFKRLCQRYTQYVSMGKDFPDEVGVLLGYPLDDVESYILNHGKNSLMTRYWKVYHNPSGKEKTFKAYDAAREQVLAEIIQGYHLNQVAV